MKLFIITYIGIMAAMLIWFNSTMNTESVEPIPKLMDNTTETRELLDEIQDNIDHLKEILGEQTE